MEVDGPSKHADSKQVFLQNTLKVCVCVSHFCADDKPAFLQLKHRILKMRQ